MIKSKKSILTAAAMVVCTAAIAAKQQQPNIIVILTDDQGSADLSCMGSTRIKSPNIDQMAAEGMILNQFYTASAVSSPSRAAILTGRMPQRAGVPNVLFPFTTSGLPDHELTIAEMLNEQGYTTSIIGKWHLGHQPEQLPTKQGFDSFYGMPYSNDMSMAQELKVSSDVKYTGDYDKKMMENDRLACKKRVTYLPIKGTTPLMYNDEVIEFPAIQHTLTERYTEKAVQFINENKKRPFFLYLAHNFPHEPMSVGKKFEGHSGNGLYCDIIEEIDWSVGEVVKAVRDSGLSDNTFIVFLSDNGPSPTNDGSAGDLRGFKSDTYEGGFRSPCIMWAPSVIKSGRYCEDIVSALDLFPTIMSLTNCDMPTDRIYDGYDLLPYLTGEQNCTPRNEIYYYNTNSMEIDGIRTNDWKYFSYGNRRDFTKKSVEKGYLYNLNTDISESSNLKTKYPQKYNELIFRMNQFDKALKQDVKETLSKYE